MKEARTESEVGALGWLQNQLYELKGQVGALEQQLGHLQAAATQATEGAAKLEGTLQGAALNAAQVPRLQDEINQAAALIVQLQDLQAEMNEKLAVLGRRTQQDEHRDQEEWLDVSRRVDQLERQVALWHDRQAGVDEVGRRFQEDLSLVRQQLQQIEQRLEGSESKAARALEGANRAEHTLTQVEATILALQREDETIAERARVAAEVAHRLESTLNQHLEALQGVELLAERIELHRAERQRLEERAMRLEEELVEQRNLLDQQGHQQGRLRGQQEGITSRLDSLQELVEQEHAALLEQLRKLTGSQTRTKRRQIQELEREIREMQRYVAGLADQ